MNDLIDHTYLDPRATVADIERLCREAIDHAFYAVCVPPFYVAPAAGFLQGSGVKVATVIGFPYGYSKTPSKVAEIRHAIEDGADELDIVINLAAVQSGDWNYVKSDLEQVTTTVRLKGKIAKIIIEVAALNEAQLGRVTDICNGLRPDFVKTSTGTQGGATVAQVSHLRANLRPEIRIKASGGIRNREAAAALIEAGANRIGTSVGPALGRP